MTTRPRVLVIDDEPAIREMFRDMLDSWGYEAAVAATGAEGLRAWKSATFDLVLTDYLMPGMTGLDVAFQMRESDPGVRVILITGSVLDERLERARAVGFTVLRKPILLPDLRAAIKRVLGAVSNANS